MVLRTWLLLAACNFFWSFHPLLGKIALESFTPLQSGLIRYGVAWAAYVVAALALRARGPIFAKPRNGRDALLIAVFGIAPFAISPVLQLTGLARTQSIDNALIVSMEPIFSVVLAWLVLKERLDLGQWSAFFVATLGFLLLSGFDPRDFSAGGEAAAARFFGCFLMMMALWGEATYSVVARILSTRYPVLPLFGSAITVGAASLAIYVLSRESFPPWSAIRPESLGALLWLGVVGTALSYILWLRAVRDAPVASLVITLFIQPLLGLLWGVWFRGERLGLKEVGGAGLILAAVGAQSWRELRAVKK